MTIRIDDLSFEAVIGILEHERLQPQRVRVNARIDYTYAKEFIDYAEVCTTIKTIVIQKQFGLLEEALETLQSALKEQFPLIETLTLSIAKPDILPDATVTMEMTYHYETSCNTAKTLRS